VVGADALCLPAIPGYREGGRLGMIFEGDPLFTALTTAAAWYDSDLELYRTDCGLRTLIAYLPWLGSLYTSDYSYARNW